MEKLEHRWTAPNMKGGDTFCSLCFMTAKEADALQSDSCSVAQWLVDRGYSRVFVASSVGSTK